MLVQFTAIYPSPLLSLPCVAPNVVFHKFMNYQLKTHHILVTNQDPHVIEIDSLLLLNDWELASIKRLHEHSNRTCRLQLDISAEASASNQLQSVLLLPSFAQ